MKHLVIRNLGPLREADIELKRINVIIGSQSSGKSCVLKTACYCTWVEKRIELTQTDDFFTKDNNFLKELERFHKLKGYVKENTFISYESDFMSFSFDNATNTFKFEWKERRWDYHRTKVTYIPAERNLVAAIPNWFQVKFADDNIRDFMADWETARQATTSDFSVLNLGVLYHYDADTKSDKVEVSEGVTLDFTNTSSGLQSVIPLLVHLNYICNIDKEENSIGSVYTNHENKKLLQSVLEDFLNKKTVRLLQDSDKLPSDDNTLFSFGGNLFALTNKEEQEFHAAFSRFVNTHHCDIFLEEPEANLFPPTQSCLIEWLLSVTKGEQPSNLFIATHSPYVLGTLLEKKDMDVNMLYTRIKGDGILIKTASEQDIQDIYDYGIDAFFNIETLGYEA